MKRLVFLDKTFLDGSFERLSSEVILWILMEIEDVFYEGSS